MVAKGFSQEPCIDYSKTFSPVVKSTTIRDVLSIAVASGWSIRQLDVHNAFFHGFISEELYMRQPPSFQDERFPHHVCKLQRSLYGLKQAPRAWFQRLSSFLLGLGFSGSKTDSSLFMKRSGGLILYILVYVDDILITGNKSSAISKLLCSLGNEFAIKDLGSVRYFLGIEVLPNSHSLLLSQQKYCLDLLARTNVIGAKPLSTPISLTLRLSKFTGKPLSDPTEYKSIVGALQYATLTRPDITFVVNKVAQFMVSLTDDHWMAVKRILRYLKGTISHGLQLFKFSPLTLSTYSDVDWASCSDDRKSTSGYLVYLGKNLISWKSRKQDTVARSSTKREYRAMALATMEIIWVQAFLGELGVKSPPPILWCDNIGATYLSVNPVFHARTKHIKIDFHFVRDKVALGALKVFFIPTDDQIADILTKGLSSTKFMFFQSKLNLVQGQLSLQGAIKSILTHIKSFV